MEPDGFDYLGLFRLPKPVKITARTSSITNSFINGLIPVVVPTTDQVKEALTILGMGIDVECAYCGDACSEWDHLRPLVVKKQPTGYITEIHNLVPACGKCNQSKGNRHWKEWMFGTAAQSPLTRNVSDRLERAERLSAYEAWLPPTVLKFDGLVDPELWEAHWEYHERVIELMREAEVTATKIRQQIKDNYLTSDGQAPANSPL